MTSDQIGTIGYGYVKRALTPFCGGVEPTKNRPEADQQQPVVAGERKVAQHNDDDAEDEQHEHEHGHPRLTDLF